MACFLVSYETGFRRITKGPEAGAYRHDLFRRDEPDVCLGMRRSKQNGKSPSLGPTTSPSIRGRRRSGSVESYSSATSERNTPELAPSSSTLEPIGLSLLPGVATVASSTNGSLSRKSSFKNLSSFSMQTIAEGPPAPQTGLSVLMNHNNTNAAVRLDNPERQASALAAAGMVADAVERSKCVPTIDLKDAGVPVCDVSSTSVAPNSEASASNAQQYSSFHVLSQQHTMNYGWAMPIPSEMITHFDDIDMELDFFNMFSCENEMAMLQFLPDAAGATLASESEPAAPAGNPTT